MNCMKCGREISEGQAFCEECLKIMEQYPVRPGSYVRIPKRNDYEDSKPVRRKKELSLEEQIQRLKNLVHWLTIAVVSLLAALILVGLFSLKDYLIPQEEPQTSMERNYTVTQTDEK